MGNLNYFLKQMHGYDTTASYIDDLTQMNRAFAFNDHVTEIFNELSIEDKDIASKLFFELHNKTLR
tara:strand:- start:232 stop:429 length:198 start_codon:yes stop_codon:yes gene_type:complete